MAVAEPAVADSRWVAFQSRSFRKYWLGRLSAVFAIQVFTVSIGWQVYDLTRDPFDLGIVGLSQFVPALLLVLVTGATADRFQRSRIIALCLLAQGLCAGALLFFTWSDLADVRLIFAVLVAFGVARAFFGPAQQSMLANVVPPQHIANAIAVSSTGWQFAMITGPAAGGLLYGVSPELAYGVTLFLLAGAAILILSIGKTAQKVSTGPTTWESVVAGFRYIWHEKIVLGAISLDLFAVLLGGAVALLPVYARDILEVGPWGLGLLRAAPAVGAMCVALYLTTRTLRDHAGLLMFGFVAVFGIFTVVFGLSTVTWLSIAALLLMGCADMVSVYIRETLIQLWTPDAVRGRVNAVNMVFIGASNELGAFRAGVMAALIGTVPAVVVGGLGTVAVAALWMKWFPELRRVRHLNGRV
jgi:MFS family permease